MSRVCTYGAGIDYEDLLMRYIAHVNLEEGADFIDYINSIAGADGYMRGGHSRVMFTIDEVKAMQQMADQGLERFNR